jgi:hypothetical protein
MKRRWLWFVVCAVLGLSLLVCGWLVPMHLRAVDAAVLKRAAAGTPSMVDSGLTAVKALNLGAARMLLDAAQSEGLPNRERLSAAAAALASLHPDWVAWGGGDTRLERLFASDASLPKKNSEPITEFLIRSDNRQVALELLKASSSPVVAELLRCRELQNTAIFSPSASASGQAFDAAIALGGLLLDGGHLSPGFSKVLENLASAANHGSGSQPLEQTLMDLVSLGQRVNWGQLIVLVHQIEDAETLRLLSGLARSSEAQLPRLFAAVDMSGKPTLVVRYLMNYSQTGPKDLATSLRLGTGAVGELLRRQQPVSIDQSRLQAAAYNPFGAFYDVMLAVSWRNPGAALALKWFIYLFSGFMLAAAGHFAWPAISRAEQPYQARVFNFARESLFALGFLLVVLLLSEPFLAQESQKTDLPFRLKLPMVGSAVPAGVARDHQSLMNNLSILTLLLFFVLQALIYTACVVKLAEIRRQPVPARLKLKLLENEEHLFDAGLYLGFAGTIVSLILVSMGVIKPSLMAAYSSTSFGIVFVSIFKIFHLRPARRKLLVEVESAPAQPVVAPAGRALAMSS